mmetsp:Transcript_6668/g.15327  ORF Transcript_6668/g.15327 Transcript_6668/m.15327 type:complete len:511 (+) Transcript_6668:50-1582(+)
MKRANVDDEISLVAKKPRALDPEVEKAIPERFEVATTDDLAAILGKATRGSVLTFAAGEHICGVDVTVDLTLEGADDATLVCTTERPTLRVSSTVIIRGLALKHAKDDSLPIVSQPTCVEVLQGGNLTLDNCKVSGSGHGLEITGASATMKNCVISHTGGRAALWKEGAKGSMDSCEVSDTQGLVVDGPESELSLKECKISRNAFDGVLVTDGAKAISDGCEIYENAVGVRVDGQQSQVTLDGCQLHGNREDGLLVQGEGKGVLTSSSFFNNEGTGVHVQEKSEICLTDCKMFDDKEGGVAITDGSRAIITGCEVYRNGESGLRVETSTVAVTDCQLHDQDGAGVLVLDAGKARVTDCDIFDNATEVRVEVSQVQMLGTKVHSNADHESEGFLIMHGGQAVIQNCQMQNTAVQVANNAQALVDRCSLEGEGDVTFMDGCTGSVRQCTFAAGSSNIVNEGAGAVNVEGCTREGESVTGTHIDAPPSPSFTADTMLDPRTSIHDRATAASTN